MASNNVLNLRFPVSAALGGSGVASPTAHGILVAEGSSAFTPIVLTDGQLLIGSTGADPVAASLTAGTGIAITPSAGGISISTTGTGFVWTTVTGTTQSMSNDNGYIANNAGLVTLTLPATSAVGAELAVEGLGAGGWLIAQGSGQSIRLGDTASTSGVTGSIASVNQYDSVRMVCVVADTQWKVYSGVSQAFSIL